jgi:hypothetical protein
VRPAVRFTAILSGRLRTRFASNSRGAIATATGQLRATDYVASDRTTEQSAVSEADASNELEGLQQVLSTLAPLSRAFLVSRNLEACRLHPGAIPRLADVQFLETTLRVLDTWKRQKSGCRRYHGS